MRVAFAGTPTFAATVLEGILASAHEVGLVISQPDPRSGRGRKTSQTPVARLATEASLPLTRPQRVSDAAAEVAKLDALVVAAYGQILRPNTLYAARHDAWNVHASLLPKYRGAAPVERAIMAGEKESGVTIMKIDEGLDTGPMALQMTTPIPTSMTGGELTETLAQLGAKAVVEVLDAIEAGSVNLVEQDSLKATYASKVVREDQVLRWDRGAKELHNLVRALAPHIGARAFHPDYDGPLKIWRSRIESDRESELNPGEIDVQNGRFYVGCERGTLEVLEVQAPGGRKLGAGAFLRGHDVEGSFAV